MPYRPIDRRLVAETSQDSSLRRSCRPRRSCQRSPRRLVPPSHAPRISEPYIVARSPVEPGWRASYDQADHADNRWRRRGSTFTMIGTIAQDRSPSPAAAQPAMSANASVFATGIDDPRGLDFGSDGYLNIAEGGTGGTTSTEGQCDQVVAPVGPYASNVPQAARMSRRLNAWGSADWCATRPKISFMAKSMAVHCQTRLDMPDNRPTWKRSKPTNSPGRLTLRWRSGSAGAACLGQAGADAPQSEAGMPSVRPSPHSSQPEITFCS